MKEYHKIPALFKFEQTTKKHIYGNFSILEVELLKTHLWIVTEKIHGTNFRIHWDGHKLNYAGRTDNAEFSKHQIEYIKQNLVNLDIEQVFEQMFMEKEVLIHGELFGAGINNGGLYTDNNGLGFKVFDIEIGGLFLRKYDAKDLANDLGYDFVPIVGEMTLLEAFNELSVRSTSYFSEAELEGYVATPKGDFLTRLGKRIIVKIKKRDIEEK